MVRVFTMLAAIAFTLSGCVVPYQFVEVKQTISRPFFTVKKEMGVESVMVLLLKTPDGAATNITSEIVWNVLALAKDSRKSTQSVQYGIAPEGFTELIAPQELERGNLYQVDISGAARTHASGHFFFVPDKSDDVALNVHFVDNVVSLIDCIKKNQTREMVLAVCRSEDWVIQGQENWNTRIEYLVKKRRLN